MFSIFEKEYVATCGMLVCFALSLLIRMFLGMLYHKMIQETDNMATTDNRLLKQCKLKFTNCFQLNNGVANVPVFVEKFLCKLAIGPFSFGSLYHMAGQLMLLSVIFSGIGVCRSIIAGSMFGEILPFYICSMIELYLYFSLSTVLDLKGKRQTLKINLIDYLENHLSHRMNVTKADVCMLYGEESGGPSQKGLDLLPIAGWLADREVIFRESKTEENYSAQKKREEIGLEGTRPYLAKDRPEVELVPVVGEYEEGEAEALEELLKEFLSMS